MKKLSHAFLPGKDLVTSWHTNYNVLTNVCSNSWCFFPKSDSFFLQQRQRPVWLGLVLYKVAHFSFFSVCLTDARLFGQSGFWGHSCVCSCWQWLPFSDSTWSSQHSCFCCPLGDITQQVKGMGPLSSLCSHPNAMYFLTT